MTPLRQIGLWMVLASLFASAAPAGVPTARRPGAWTIMQILVDGTNEVVVTDPRGRSYPCVDSTCTPIPDCASISDFGVRPRESIGGEPSHQILLRLPSPLEGKYRIHAIGSNQYVFVSLEVFGPGMRCGQLGGIDGQRGTTYVWDALWHRAPRDSACSARLDLLPRPQSRPHK